MNKVDRLVLVALWVALVSVPGCALRKGPPDPAEVQQQSEKAQASEPELIGSTVEDPAKAAQVVELARRRNALVEQHAGTVQSYLISIRALNADYDSTREDFERVITAYNVKRETRQHAIAAVIEDMKSATTAAEWKTLARYQLKNLNPRDIVYSDREN